PLPIMYLLTCFTVLLLLSQLFSGLVERRLNPWVTTAVWDIAGVNYRINGHADVQGYNCVTSDPLVFGEHKLFEVNLPEGPTLSNTELEAAHLSRVWFDTLRKNPVAYLRHRLCVGKAFLGFANSVHYPYPAPLYVDTFLTQRAERSSLNRDLYWSFDSSSQRSMYKYALYLGASLIALLLSLLFRVCDSALIFVFASVVASAARF